MSVIIKCLDKVSLLLLFCFLPFTNLNKKSHLNNYQNLQILFQLLAKLPCSKLKPQNIFLIITRFLTFDGILNF